MRPVAPGRNGNHGGRARRGFKSPRPILAAVDLGAESCRVSLLRWVNEQPEIQLVHRFSNTPVREQASLRWDIQRICDGVEEGLRGCADIVPEGIAAIGVDGWAVDYVRLDAAGEPVADPFCYRDERTVAALKDVHKRISADLLYRLTGGQILPLNTLYQLYADGVEQQSKPWLNLPEFMLHRLGGRRVSEYTNATHTQMFGIQSQEWCEEIFSAAGLELKAAPPVVRPGTDVGPVGGKLARLRAFRDTRLIVPACHDTASAIAGIPADGEDWAFVSSGTWSLVGCILDSPRLGSAARRANFSNEGGVGGKINFLKNVNGMWLLQQCIAQWEAHGHVWTVDRLLKECAMLPPPPCILDVGDPELLLPGNMPARIYAQLSRRGLPPVPQEPGGAPLVANLIFYSLAARYAAVLHELTRVTGRRFKQLWIVGGGSRNSLLNRLTAEATGLEVVTGPSESSTIGNFAIQLAALAGEFRRETGVAAQAVAYWAGVLASKHEAPKLQAT